MNMPIVERLGLSQQLEAIGIRKLGADFPADNERGYNVFSFDRCLNPKETRSARMRFDSSNDACLTLPLHFATRRRRASNIGRSIRTRRCRATCSAP